MTYRIVLEPSGRSFPAEPGETLLEAALRAGVGVHYNCSNGTCGGCKVRVREGAAGEERPHDFPLPAAERAQGYVLLCATTPGGDMVIEGEETHDPRAIPRQHLTARVAKLELLESGRADLQLRTPRSQTLRFLAGQWVELGIPGLPPQRLHIASCPCNGMVLHFHLRPSPLLEHFRSGIHHEEVAVDGPGGNFVLDEDSRRPLLFVAEDTGLAPVKSLLEHALALELSQPMTLLWAAGPEGLYLPHYGRALVDTLDDFRFLPAVATEGEPPEEAACRVLTGAGLDLPVHDAYLCGSPAFLAAVGDVLRQGGLPPERLYQTPDLLSGVS